MKNETLDALNAQADELVETVPLLLLDGEDRLLMHDGVTILRGYDPHKILRLCFAARELAKQIRDTLAAEPRRKTPTPKKANGEDAK